ncbi:MAG TPA: YkgJ family cysteine cluster protein [Gemmatimonadales bacterium]|nr:YkgJ family cysteine cluster protein [Gemmatimonadales bacterium]
MTETYQALLTRLDAWFAEGMARHGAIVPCRAGCTACCHGPFDISAADAELLRAGLATLPPGERAEVRVRAELILTRMQALAPGWGAPYDIADLGDEGFDRVAEALADLPCPMLGDDGRCRVYAYRPLVCRLIGLPMLTDLGETLENACPIQDRFPGYPELPGVPFDYASFAAEEMAILAALDGPETTIAAVAAEL